MFFWNSLAFSMIQQTPEVYNNCIYYIYRTSPMAQMVESLPAMQETWVHSLDREDLPEKEVATPLYSWSCTTITVWDSPPQKEALNLLTVTLRPPPSPSGQHSCFQSLQIFLFCIFHIHGITQYVLFVACPPSFNNVFKCVRVVACVRTSFLFMADDYSIVQA